MMITLERLTTTRKQTLFTTIVFVLLLLLLAAAHADKGTFKDRQQESINHLTWQKIATNPRRSVAASLGLPRSSPLAARPATFKPETGRLRVMIVLDRSGSMSQEQRLTLAKQGAKLFVNLLNTGDSVGVTSFDCASQISFPLTTITGTATKAAAKSAIDAITHDSSTLSVEGLRAALDQFNAQPDRSSKNIIVLLTDGDFDCGISPESIIPSLGESGVTALTVSVGAGISTAGQSALQRVASQSGGKYFHVSNSSSLVGVFFQLLLESRIKSNGLLMHAPLAVTSGQLKEIPVDVEAGAASAIFGLAMSDPADKISLSLRSPTGTVITMADAKGSNPNIAFISEFNSKALQVFAPEPGTWKIMLKAGNVKTSELDIFASAEHDGLQLTASLTKNILAFPEVAHIQAIPTFGGENVVGAIVKGTVTRPDGLKVAVTLFDDGLKTHGDSVPGDGIYSALFNQYKGDGTYSFELTAKNLNGMTYGGAGMLSLSSSSAKPVSPYTRMVSVTAVVTGVPKSVDDPPDLSLTKTDLADPVVIGEDISYHLVLTNNGPSDATEVTVTDGLPANTTFVSATSSVGSCSTAPNNKVVCALGDLMNGAMASVDIVVKSGGNPQTIFNEATVTANEVDPSPSNNEASESTTLIGLRDISFSPIILTGGCQSSVGHLLLTGPAPQGGLTVTLHSDNPYAHVPPTVTFNPGDTSITFPAETDGVDGEQIVTVSASAGSSSVEARLKLIPVKIVSLTFTPNPVDSGNFATATVTLSCPAPEPILLTLSSDKEAAQPTVSQIIIPAGQMSGQFTITTQNQSSVVAVTIKVTGPDGTSRSAVLTINASTPQVMLDNYYYLLDKYQQGMSRAENEENEDEQQSASGITLPVEKMFPIEFDRWRRYWIDHLNAGAHERGKMIDMTLPLNRYFSAAQNASKGGLSPQTDPAVCPSAGLGNWTSLGPSTYAAPIMGKVTSVYIDSSNPLKAYAGAGEGGLFKTANNGGFWTNLTDASHYPTLGITSIAVHPTTPTTLYIGTRNGPPGGGTYGFGILKSTNGGTTWKEVFTLASYNNQTNYLIGQGAYVTKVVLHPQNPNYVYALASHYVFRSTNAGASWEKVMEIVPPNPNPEGCGYRLNDIDIINGASGVNNSRVIVSTVRSAWLGVANSPCGTAKAFISMNGGANGTFTDITSAVVGSDFTDRIAVATQLSNSAEFFVGYPNMSTNYFILKKYNIASNTATFLGKIPNGVFQLGTGFWSMELEGSKLNANTLYVGGTTLYRISLAGGGFSYAQISWYWATDPFTCTFASDEHADVRAMMVGKTGTNDLVVIGTDGGIHKALLDPATTYTASTAGWYDMTGPGLAINEFYDINGLQSNPNVLVGGTQDNGTFEYNNGKWAQRYNFDGWQGTINQTTGVYFGMTNAGPIKGLTGTAGTFSYASAPAIGQGPVVSDPNNSSIIYGGAASVYKSINFGNSWTTLPPPLGNTRIRAIHVAPSNSNVIYVARSEPTWDPNNLTKHLFRSNNGGNSWTDIGINLPPLAWAGISDIAVDPNNSNRVWVSFTDYWEVSSSSLSGANRVYYSGDGGNSWSDFTYDMLAFPVACLIYQRGSDDVLYAGTDVGVFRYNKSLHSWECFSNQLPVVPVIRLEINYCKNEIVCSTAGRSVYISDLPALPSAVVSTSTTWSGVRYLSNDLTITPGTTLTLTGTLYMSRDTRIIVQRGATLNVNGGTITNACGEMWYGIELWGTASAPQNLAGAQGRVIVQYGKIENAIEAITTGKDVNSSLDFSYTGGIVQASNSYFYNNRRSAQFMYYHWISGSSELSNLSFFRNCTFETNRLLNDPNILPYAHISLYEVKNVGILGCKFNNTTSTSVFGVNNRGDGIVSFDAQYTVDDQLFFGILLAPSVFNGLTYGVRADFTPGVNKQVLILRSDFNNVQRGVQITNSLQSAVNTNNFNALPNAQTANFADATWGVRMKNASKLSVIGNTATGVSASYQNNYGVIIDNCGSFPSNQVRGNTLKNLYTGIQTQGNNGSGANGLRVRCNVFKPSMAYQLAAQGTLANQGSACVLGSTVDNTFFVQSSPPGSQINAPGVTFSYYASGTVPVNILGSVTVNTCSSVSGECQ